LVAAVSTFLADAGANIVSLDQHSTEQTGGTFMQRTIFHLPGLTAARDEPERDFADRVAARFGMDFRLTESGKPKRVAIMASTEDHCLLDLLWRNRRGELHMSVGMEIANHPDLANQVRPFVCRRAKRSARTPNGASSTWCAETSTWWCWPATCRS
jgi:formyltetrahydrofolate deformylase